MAKIHFQRQGSKGYKSSSVRQRDPTWYCMPFPVLYHDYSTSGYPLLSVNRVDCISLPAMVVPTAITHEAYIETDHHSRQKLMFYSIPYQFLVRDKWQNVEDASRKAAEGQVAEKTVLVYESASEVERRRLLSKIKEYAFPGPPPKVHREDNYFSDTSDDEESAKDEDEDESENEDEDSTSTSSTSTSRSRSSSSSSSTDDDGGDESLEESILKRYKKYGKKRGV